MPKSYNPMLYKNSDVSDDETVESNDSITVEKNKIMFYSDVDPKSCLKLIQCLDKAKQFVWE